MEIKDNCTTGYGKVLTIVYLNKQDMEDLTNKIEPVRRIIITPTLTEVEIEEPKALTGFEGETINKADLIAYLKNETKNHEYAAEDYIQEIGDTERGDEEFAKAEVLSKLIKYLQG